MEIGEGRGGRNSRWSEGVDGHGAEDGGVELVLGLRPLWRSVWLRGSRGGGVLKIFM